MIITKSAVVAALRERGLHQRADWVERELPDSIDSFKYSGLLATLHLDPAELVDSTPPG